MPTDPLDDPKPPIAERKTARLIGCAIGRIVVNNEHFPARWPKRCFNPVDQWRKIITLVERWQDDRKSKLGFVHLLLRFPYFLMT
jgi:adenine deaminase